MTAARVRRVDRLEDAAVLRASHEAAVTYELTSEETVLVIRDTKPALARQRAGLRVDLDWMLDEAVAELGLNAAERTELGADVRCRLAARSSKEQR